MARTEVDGPDGDDIDRGARWLRRDVRRATASGAKGIGARADHRLRQLVRHARTHSPLFADLYRDIDPGTMVIDDLPMTQKASLMEAFDDWCTDRRITTAAVEEFAERCSGIGDRFLGDYLYSETSGTTGIPGRFVTEDTAIGVTDALGSRIPRPAVRTIARGLRRGGRAAAIISVNGHHTGPARYHGLANGPNPRVRMLSVLDPIADLTESLDDFDPASITSYSSTLGALAHEQLEGRLHIDPAVVLPISETVTPAVRDLITRAWPRAQTIERYVATECMILAARCHAGWHHLNADWVILEPIDAAGQPCAPGEVSNSVLLTNLHRRVQPVIRYELGDSILMRPQACECGSPLPAFEVYGRSGEPLVFTVDGRRTLVSPIALTVLLDEVPGVRQLQVIRDADHHLSLRISTSPAADPTATGQEAVRRLRHFLADAGLRHVDVDVVDDPPERSTGGKFVRVIDLVSCA